MQSFMAKRSIKVFLDSNVILSGFLSDKGAPCIILDILSLKTPFLKGATGQYNVMEIERNLKKKAPDLLPLYNKYFPSLKLEIVPLPLMSEIKNISGNIPEKDIPVIVSALNCSANILLTGDKGLLKAGGKGGYPFKLIAPSEFLDALLPEILKEQDRS